MMWWLHMYYVIIDLYTTSRCVHYAHNCVGRAFEEFTPRACRMEPASAHIVAGRSSEYDESNAVCVNRRQLRRRGPCIVACPTAATSNHYR